MDRPEAPPRSNIATCVMNIWMINHYATSPASSWSTRHVSLGTELVKRGHHVRLYAASFNGRSGPFCTLAAGEEVRWERSEGVEIGWLPAPNYADNSFGRAWNMLLFAYRVLQLPRLVTERPEVIYGSTPTLFAALAGLLVARRLGVPFVLEVRDIWPQTLIELGMSRLHPFVLLLAAVERYLHRHADAIVTLMPNATPHLVARGAKRERIHWIPNGVNFAIVPPVSPPSRKDRLEVMYAGAYASANGPETILAAAAILRGRNGPPLRFRFIGSQARASALLAKREALRLDNVTFERQVPKYQVYALLREADILVAPVRYLPVHRFGVSGNKVLDYMAVARPIVHAVRSSNHAVRDAGCGIECPPDDPAAMADALTILAGMSSEERWKLGLCGRRYLEQHHDFARLAVKLESVLVGALREPLARSTSLERLELVERANPFQPSD